MSAIIKKLSTRLGVALLTFTVSVAVGLLWATPYFRNGGAPGGVEIPDSLEHTEQSSPKVASMPEGWKSLDVKGKLTLRLPQDMWPSALMGDSLNHREAYSNRDLNVTVIYGEYAPCAPRHVPDRPSYRESIIDVGGRKAKLGIDRNYQPDHIIANVCFLKADAASMRLNVVAFCRDDRALETAQQIFSSIRFKDDR